VPSLENKLMVLDRNFLNLVPTLSLVGDLGSLSVASSLSLSSGLLGGELSFSAIEVDSGGDMEMVVVGVVGAESVSSCVGSS